MNNFKLLAIRPSIDCNVQFLKNLKPGVFYKFYQDFHFELDSKNNKVIQITYESNVPSDLYGDNISVSAVVGKNGSGKSTIVELFCAFVFCLSIELKLININAFKVDHSLSKEDQKRLQNEINDFKLFSCELYFMIDNVVYSLIKTGSVFNQKKYEIINSKDEKVSVFKKSTDNGKSLDLHHERELSDFMYFSYFYSILANYSLYGLNTNESGIWLKSIFHKNDGYQTPIVLNPMRTEGRIDINRLTYLSKSRLLSNVFIDLEKDQKQEDSLRCLVNNKIVHKIILSLDFKKFTEVDESNIKPEQNARYILDLYGKSIYLTYTELNKTRNEHNYLRLIIKAFYPNYTFTDARLSNTKTKKIAIEYILGKAEDIIKKYTQFSAFKNRVFRVNAKEEIIKQAFDKLADDFTHRTFKLRQALNFLVKDFYNFKDEINKTFALSDQKKEGIADIINQNINEILNNELKENKQEWEKIGNSFDFDENQKRAYLRHKLINYLPPSFFEIDFEFKGKGLYKDLSSGEKQMIFSINSIIYHLINLDSINSMEFDSEDGISYKNFNIIFDEIELYFHPEFQRIYINELLKSLSFLDNKNYKFNIIFLTHSPFILSDIPKSNIMRLVDGDIEFRDEQTYASNVHDLLANDFFLERGFMGEFAKEKIKDLLRYLTYDKEKGNSEENESPKFNWNPQKAEGFISIIGEPLLKYDLKEIFLSKFYSAVEIDKQIEKLQELKRQKENR